MTFSADGSRLAASHENGQVIIWSFPDPEGESNARPEIILQITDVPWGGKPGFSPDGSLLAVPNRQGITLYDAETGEAIIELEGGASTTTYSPDGRMIATAGIDGLVRILAANLDSLLELAETRVTRLLTDEECRKYLHLKACPQGSGTD